MPYNSCIRILRSNLCALIIGLVALGAPVAYAQENGTPGAGGPNFTIYPRLLNTSNAWSNIQRDPPCIPSTTSGTITLTLNDCPNPRNARKSGSPSYWQINLTGNSTLAVTGLDVGQVFRVDIVAGGFTLALPNNFLLPASSPAVSGNSFITCEVHDINTIWCPGGMQVGLIAGTTKSFVQGSINAINSAGATSVSWTSSPALVAGQTILCHVETAGSPAPSSVSDGGSNSLTMLHSASNDGGFDSLWYEINIVGTPTTITANFSSSATFRQMGCDVFAGVIALDGHTVSSQSAPGTGTDAILANITTTSNGDIIYGVNLSSTSSSTASIGTGYTLASTTGGGGWSPITEYKTQTSAGSVNATFTAINGAANFDTYVVGLH